MTKQQIEKLEAISDSKAELAEIIADLLDGSCTAHEIRCNTGLTQRRCGETR